MEEIYKETIEESERFDGKRYRKFIFEEFTVYNEKVKKNAYINDNKAYVRYEFNFDGRVREENMYINLFAYALGYTGDFEKDIKSETIEYMSDYFPDYDLYLEFEREGDKIKITTDKIYGKFMVICNSDNLRKSHEIFDEPIINAYAEYIRFRKEGYSR